MNDLCELSLGIGTVQLNTAVMGSQKTRHFAVAVGYLDKRIGTKKHLDSFVAPFPVPFDDHRSDLCHLCSCSFYFVNDSIEFFAELLTGMLP